MVSLPVIILSAGRGFRLNPFTLDRPKSLCTIANITLLRRILDSLKHDGFSESVLVVPRSAESLRAVALANAPTGFRLDISFLDADSLGQVGIVRAITPRYRGPILVIYGDSLISADFRKLVGLHHQNRSNRALATILYHHPADILVPEKNGRTYHGVMSVADDGIVTRFIEKPQVREICDGFDCANAAVFVLERELLDEPAFSRARNFSFDLFQPAVEGRLPIYASDIGLGFRFDVGGVSRLYDLSIRIVQRAISAPIPGQEVSPGIWIDGHSSTHGRLTSPVIIGQEVSVDEHAALGPDTIIGDGCCIGGNARIRRSVIMEGCRIGSNVDIDLSLIGPHCAIADGVSVPKFTCLGPYTVLGNESWPNWAEDKKFQYL